MTFKQILIMIAIVNFSPYLFPDPDPKNEHVANLPVLCPPHFAAEVPEVDPSFPGAYVKCEDWTNYFYLVTHHDQEGARKLLFKEPPKDYDKTKRWGKYGKIQRRDERGNGSTVSIK